MAETADQVIHFSEYFKIIRNRLWVIFTILMLTLLSGAFVTEEILPKVYTSVAEIQIHHRGEVEAPSLNPASQQDKPFDPTDFQAEFEIMQTKEILLPIIADLDLKHVWAKRIYKGSRDVLTDQEALVYMNGILRFDFKRGTNLVTITASSELPQEAADIANRLADQYKKNARQCAGREE